MLLLYIPNQISSKAVGIADKALNAGTVASYAILGTNLLFNIFL